MSNTQQPERFDAGEFVYFENDAGYDFTGTVIQDDGGAFVMVDLNNIAVPVKRHLLFVQHGCQ